MEKLYVETRSRVYKLDETELKSVIKNYLENVLGEVLPKTTTVVFDLSDGLHATVTTIDDEDVSHG